MADVEGLAPYNGNRQYAGERDGYDRRAVPRRDPSQDDEELSSKDFRQFSEDAFHQTADALTRTDVDKTVRLFGMFDVDAGVAAAASSVYNLTTDFLSHKVAPRAQDLVTKYGYKVGLEGAHLTHAAAVAAFASEIVLKSGMFFGTVIDGYRTHAHDRTKLARTLAPVLDDIKGKHSISALAGIKEADNEVIYAHLQRIKKINHADNINNWLDLAINAGPNLLANTHELGGMWDGKRLKEIRATAKVNDESMVSEAKHYGRMMMNSLTGPLAQRWARSNNLKLNKTLQPYSSLEMILELNKQVVSKTDARSFQLPRSFQNPDRPSDSYSLEEYIARIIIAASEEMSDLSPDHTKIREALKDDLTAAVKPIASAIRKGDMSALELVRLVGERKIIHNRGRSIASPDEVRIAIQKDEPKQTSYAQIDSKEYWAQAGHREKDVEYALEQLHGDERKAFIAMTPHVIRKEIGVTEKESKLVDEAVGPRYDRTVADMVMGLHARPAEQLKKEGLAQNEIKKIDKAAALIEQQGEKAVHAFKNSPANDHGIEQVLTNWAVPQITENKMYFGKVLADGHEKMNALEATNDNETDGPIRTLKPRGKAEAADDDHDFDEVAEQEQEPKNASRKRHSQRETERRTGTHDQRGLD